MLHKVTGAGHSFQGGGGGGVLGMWGAGGGRSVRVSGAWGKREEGGRDGREFSFLTA